MARSGPTVDFAELYRRLDQAERALEGYAGTADRDEILAERARQVATPPESTQQDELQVLAFRVGGERFAVELESVDQVLELRGLTPLPGVAPQVLGVITARANVLIVLDLRPLLGLQGGGMTDLTSVVAIQVGAERFGIAAEEVEGQLGLARKVTSTAPVEGPISRVGAGLALLDLTKLMAQPSTGGTD